MKKIIIMLVVALLAPQVSQAQGTTFLSSLSQTSTGSHSVGSDSWLAAPFETGNNAGGYLLNSVQLGMTDASSTPSGFTVMVYAEANNPSTISPGSNIGSLSGSTDPATGGIFTYTPASSLTLLSGTEYFIVLTAGTTVANGSYNWSDSAFPPSSSGGWGDGNAVLRSSNGTSVWSTTPYLGIAQFAITATAIPEPSPSSLLLLGSGVFIYVRRAFHR